MNVPLFFSYYFRWHYSEAFGDIARLHGNFLWFVYNYFSMPILVQTIFDPWKRLAESDRGRSRVVSFLSNLIINSIMRCIGFVARMVTLALGAAIFLAVFVGGILFYAVWFVLPVFAVGLVLAGMNRLI